MTVGEGQFQGRSHRLLVPASTIPTQPPLHCACQVCVRVKSTGQQQRVAILIREPRHLLRNGRGAPLGAQLAQERLLEVRGFLCSAGGACNLACPVSALRTASWPCWPVGPLQALLLASVSHALLLSPASRSVSLPASTQSAGWRIVPLEAQSCLCLPVSQLSEELGALMMGDAQASSLQFLA